MKNATYPEETLARSTFIGLQNASVRPPGAHQTVAGLAFQPHSGQHAVLMCSNAVHTRFNALTVLNNKKQLFSE